MVDVYKRQDYKFPDLSEIAYNHLLNHQKGYKKIPTFYVIDVLGIALFDLLFNGTRFRL